MCADRQDPLVSASASQCGGSDRRASTAPRKLGGVAGLKLRPVTSSTPSDLSSNPSIAAQSSQFLERWRFKQKAGWKIYHSLWRFRLPRQQCHPGHRHIADSRLERESLVHIRQPHNRAHRRIRGRFRVDPIKLQPLSPHDDCLTTKTKPREGLWTPLHLMYLHMMTL